LILSRLFHRETGTSPGRGTIARWLTTLACLSVPLPGAARTPSGLPSASRVVAADPRDLYNVDRYELEVRIRPEEGLVDGQVSIMLRALDALPRVVLDLASTLVADSAWTAKGPATIERVTDRQIRITLPRPVLKDDPETLVVRYSGLPTSVPGLPFFALHDEARPVAQSPAARGQAHTWWPCKDIPADKATARIMITADQRYYAAASGRFLARVYRPDDASTWYEAETPLAPHLLSLALSDYARWRLDYRSATSGLDLAVECFSFPEDSAAAAAAWSFAVLPDSGALAVCESLFGPYPFPSLAIAEIGSCPGLPGQAILRTGCIAGAEDPRPSLVLQSARQWFGASVTPTGREDEWLAEAIPTYAQALWAEAGGGVAAYRRVMESLRQDRFPGTVAASPESVAASPPDTSQIAVSSRKGAWVLHSLRWVLRNQAPQGEATLLSIFRAFAGSYAAGNATGGDFVRLCEESAGLDLRWFFAPWVYGTGQPALAYDWSRAGSREGGEIVHLHIEQVQTDPLYPQGEPFPESPDFFPMPWEIRTFGPGGDSLSTVIWQTSRIEDFEIDAPAGVDRLVIDPDHWVLRELLPVSVPPGGPLILRAQPNPTPGPTQITFRLVSSAPARLSVFDPAGRLVRDLPLGPAASGVHLVTWNGETESGPRAAPGAYFLRLSQQEAGDTRKLILIRP
jgi:aminopeptidase N